MQLNIIFKILSKLEIYAEKYCFLIAVCSLQATIQRKTIISQKITIYITYLIGIPWPIHQHHNYHIVNDPIYLKYILLNQIWNTEFHSSHTWTSLVLCLRVSSFSLRSCSTLFFSLEDQQTMQEYLRTSATAGMVIQPPNPESLFKYIVKHSIFKWRADFSTLLIIYGTEINISCLLKKNCFLTKMW